MRVIDFFDRGAALYPDADAVHDGARGWTYSDIKTLTKRIANALLGEELTASSPVATYTPNHPMGFAAQYGVLRAGPVWVPINVRNSVEENIAVLEMLGVEWMFFHTDFASEIERIRSALPQIKGFVCLDGENTHGPSLSSWLERHTQDRDVIEKGPLDTAAILTTSGTTGRPKGIELSNLTWESVIASYQMLMTYGEDRPVHLVAAPLTHAAGCLATSLLSLGATQVLLPKPDPLAILEAIEKHRATTLFLPPTLLYMLLSHPCLHDFDYSSLRYVMYGGAPMSVQKLREASDVFGPVMCQTFGQTEALMVITFMTAREHEETLSDPVLERRLASSGRPGPLTNVAIMSDDGKLLPPGERGEIVCRGYIVMKGYLNNPEATEEVSAFGWHHTGDIGETDEDGFVYLVDRKKDMIISGGFNVYPGEVEQVLWAHPAVKDCAVIGIPDEKWGEAVTAVIELKEGMTAAEPSLIQYCKEHLGSVRAPKSIITTDALPRSSVGKVLKRELRDQYWKGRDRAI